jgi:hypothetical protein
MLNTFWSSSTVIGIAGFNVSNASVVTNSITGSVIVEGFSP